jgi:hypothetical protein
MCVRVRNRQNQTAKEFLICPNEIPSEALAHPYYEYIVIVA